MERTTCKLSDLAGQHESVCGQLMMLLSKRNEEMWADCTCRSKRIRNNLSDDATKGFTVKTNDPTEKHTCFFPPDDSMR